MTFVTEMFLEEVNERTTTLYQMTRLKAI